MSLLVIAVVGRPEGFAVQLYVIDIAILEIERDLQIFSAQAVVVILALGKRGLTRNRRLVVRIVIGGGWGLRGS